MSVLQQTEIWFNLLIMPRVDCEGSVVLDKYRLFIKRAKISGIAQNWCQTFWIFVRFWWKKTLFGETFNVTSFPKFLSFVILSLSNAKFCLWFHLNAINRSLGQEVKMPVLKIYICDSNEIMESLIASFSRFCRRQDRKKNPSIQTLTEFKAVVFQKDELEYRDMSISIALLSL